MKKIINYVLLVDLEVALVGCGSSSSSASSNSSSMTTSSTPSTVSVTDSQGDTVEVDYQPKKLSYLIIVHWIRLMLWELVIVSSGQQLPLCLTI